MKGTWRASCKENKSGLNGPSGDGTVGDESRGRDRARDSLAGCVHFPALAASLAGCAVFFPCCLDYISVHIKIMWTGTELEKSFQSSLKNVHAGCCWLASHRKICGVKTFFFFYFSLPLKHTSTFSSVCIPVTKEMTVIRNADLHPKRSGTVQAFMYLAHSPFPVSRSTEFNYCFL